MEQEQRPRTGSICQQQAHFLPRPFVVFAFHGHCCPHVEIAGYYSLEVALFCLSQAHYEEKKSFHLVAPAEKKTKQANLAIIKSLFTAQNEKVNVNIFPTAQATNKVFPGINYYKQYLMSTAKFEWPVSLTCQSVDAGWRAAADHVSLGVEASKLAACLADEALGLVVWQSVGWGSRATKLMFYGYWVGLSAAFKLILLTYLGFSVDVFYFVHFGDLKTSQKCDS